MEKCRFESNEGDVLVPAGERSDCSLPGQNLVEKMGCSNNENGVSKEEENEQRYMQVEGDVANENVRVSGGQQTEENKIVGEAGNVAINKILRGQGNRQDTQQGKGKTADQKKRENAVMQQSEC